MPPFILVGLAAGLAAAVLFASASAGGMTGRVVLFFLAPLPCYLAGLGWGSAAAALAATSSAIGAGLMLGLRTGAVYFLSQGIPLVVLCHLALLNRPSASPAVSSSPAPAIEWYPIGRLVAVATLMAGSLALLSILLLGNDLDQLKAMMRELVEKVILKQLPSLGGDKLGEPEINAMAEMLLFALPAGSALLWLGGFVLNLWLGGKITLMSGRLARPWPDVTTMRYPRGFGLGLAISLVALLLPGFAGLLASGFAGAFLFAYLLMGLAIIHFATRGLAARPFILWGVYVALFVLNTWAGLLIALLAVLEPVLPWRRPPEGGNAPPPAPTT